MQQKENKRKNIIRYQLSTFKFAFKGLKYFCLHETKARIHTIATIAVITLGIVFDIEPQEWLMICFAIGFVLATEIMNTAVELTVDEITRERKPSAGRIKDLAAGAVLIAAITALAIGLIIFIPKIIVLL